MTTIRRFRKKVLPGDYLQLFKENNPGIKKVDSRTLNAVSQLFGEVITDELKEGKGVSLPGKMGRVAILFNKRIHGRKKNRLDIKKSNLYKIDLLGCRKCNHYEIRETMKYGYCSEKKRNIPYVFECPLQPELLMNKKNPEGKKWFIYRTDDHFLSTMWYGNKSGKNISACILKAMKKLRKKCMPDQDDKVSLRKFKYCIK